MSDPAEKAADLAVSELEQRLKDIYGEAVKEMQAQLDEFIKKYGEKLAEKQQQKDDGEIDDKAFYSWMNAQKDIRKNLEAKIDQMTGVMLNANRKALAMVNGEQFNVFAEGANWQSYKLEKEARMDLGFTVYDEDTVQRLIKERPELMPRRRLVNGKRDKAWNQHLIAGAVTRAVIQGESIPKLARRISKETGVKNSKAMMRYARTCMTGAQNAGRIESLHRAKDMGIKVKKQWLATLDGRTRDSHREMDGVTVDVDDTFDTPLGSKMEYPGDINNGKDADIWNCRCTMVYVYEGFPDQNAKRRDNETGEVIDNMTYNQWKSSKKKQQTSTKAAPKPALEEKLHSRTIQKYQPDEWDDKYDKKDIEMENLLAEIKKQRAELIARYAQLPRGPERYAINQELNKLTDKAIEIRKHIDNKYGIEQVARLLNNNVEWVPVRVLDKPLDEETIIGKLCGGDLTKGSCASLAFAYVAQKAGYDIVDFRDGKSRTTFSTGCVRILRTLKENGMNGVFVGKAKSYLTAGKRALKSVEPGKQYYFECGRHATIVRMNENRLEYLELQSGVQNGWLPFERYGSIDNALNRRFGAPKSSRGYEVDSFLIDVDEMAKSKRLMKLMGYINTEPDKQAKGAHGYEK